MYNVLSKFKSVNIHRTINKPIFFNLKLKQDQKKLQNLLKQKGRVIKIMDEFEGQVKELFFVRNPSLKVNPEFGKNQWKEYLNKSCQLCSLWQQGKWVYFDWNNCLVHILNHEDFFELRSARNCDLINKKEQKIFRNLKVGIAGLSVGSNVALSLVLEGGAETMKLADFDELSLSNLNRIQSGICGLGVNKAELVARKVYELNPYAKIYLYSKGLNKNNLEKFFTKPEKLDIIIDEMDDLVMKIKLRKLAKKYKIPLVSAADNGDHSIIDIENYKLEPKREVFHGNLGNDIDENKILKMNFGERIKLVNKIVGVQYIVKRMQESLLEIGKTLYSWPQLGGAAMLNGAVLVYIIRRIALGEKISSGKYEVNLDRAFIRNYDTSINKKRRKNNVEQFLKKQEKIFK